MSEYLGCLCPKCSLWQTKHWITIHDNKRNTNDVGPLKGTAGYLARNTACLISCSAFLNSLFTTQACSRITSQTSHKHDCLMDFLTGYSRLLFGRHTLQMQPTVISENLVTDVNRINLGGLPEDVNYYFNRQPWSYFLHSLYTPPVCLEEAGKRYFSSNSIPFGLDYCKTTSFFPFQ